MVGGCLGHELGHLGSLSRTNGQATQAQKQWVPCRAGLRRAKMLAFEEGREFVHHEML